MGQLNLCKEMNHTFVQFAVCDYTKSMGVPRITLPKKCRKICAKHCPVSTNLKSYYEMKHC
jgi:hypothetical protein